MRAIGLSLVLAVGLAGPAAADPFRPSVADQIKLGKRFAEQIRKDEKVVSRDDPRVVLMNRVGQVIVGMIPAEERKRRPFEYTFDLIDNKELNAFAVPGGPIFFYTGLFDRFKTEDQLAAVVAHEIVHVRNQHWASAYADATKRRLGLTAVLMLFNAGTTLVNIADIADTLLVELPYSRRHETEADNVGYDLMTQAGYHPQGMIDAFRILAEAGTGKGPQWLSTHPDVRNRIRRLEERLAKEKRSFSPQRPISLAQDD
jgi:predicted Zn-dependent protease